MAKRLGFDSEIVNPFTLDIICAASFPRPFNITLNGLVLTLLADKAKNKQQVTINLNTTTIAYFKEISSESGVPYQVLINLYLDQCVKDKKKLQFV